MKTRIAFTTLLLSLLTLLTACQKEEPHDTLPAGALRLTTESFTGANGDKTSVSGNTVQWRNGDVVNINGTNYTVTVDAVNHTAYIDGSFGTEELFAYYPNDAMEIRAVQMTDGFIMTSYSLSFPSSYDCTFENDRQVIALPMMARASGGSTTIQFYHSTAAVNVNLWNATDNLLTVTQVVVKSDDYALGHNNSWICGTNTKPDPTVISSSQTNNEAWRRVEVNIPSGSLEVPASNDASIIREVQVPIQPIGEDSLTIEVHCTDGTNNYVYSHKESCPALSRNQMLTARVRLYTGAGGHMTTEPPTSK